MSAARRLAWGGALRHRNFRLFWFGQLVSLIGTWMQQVAQAWLVLQLTGDPFWLGVVAAAQFLPVMILGVFAGVLVDVLPKRLTLVGTQAASMVLALLLAFLSATEVVEVWQIVVLAALLGTVNAIDMPTRQAFVIEMVGRGDVGNAVGLNSAIFNGARILGPAVAGLLIGALGVAACFFINGLSYLAVIAGLLAMRDRELTSVGRAVRPRTAAAVRANLAEGIRYVRTTPVVLLAVVLVGLVATAGMNFTVVMPALADEVLDVGAEGLGFLMASMGAGSLVAALGVARSGRPSMRVLLGGAVVLGSFEVVLGLVHWYPLALAAAFGVGAGAIAMAASANATIQLAVPDHLRGRVMAVYLTVFAGSTPIGGVLTGVIASAAGTAAAVLVGGVVVLAVAFGAVAWVRRTPGLALASEPFTALAVD